MTGPAAPAPPASTAPTPQGPLGGGLGDLWPERRPDPAPRLVLAALLVGVAAAVVLPGSTPGVGYFLVLLAAVGVVAYADDRLRSPRHLCGAVLCTLLLSTLFLLDAAWVVALCVLASVAVGVTTLVDARSVTGIVASSMALPLAALRGMPWLARSTRPASRVESWVPAARTAVVSVLLVGVFGLLFASADALFSTWTGALVPDINGPWLAGRLFVTAVFFGLTMTGAYVAANPPRVERLALPPGQAVRRPFEWLVPVSVVIAVYAVFVVAQATAMFGGHDYLRRTTGLTYAEYVHQGFAQMVVATLLTLAVVAVAARKAPRETARDRLRLRLALGLLCVLTLVVVASAIYRMHVYEQAYGFTRLRLLVSVFEGWLGLVVVLVLAAGVRINGRWVPQAALLSGAVTLLALAAVNPDAYIAGANLDRLAQTGKVDAAYLRGLSDDATPTLARRWDAAQPCRTEAEGGRSADGLSWNLSRVRSQRLGCP